MMSQLPPHHDATYSVNLPDFQGPLDLLLTLIQDQALDITKISLAHVTDQYLRYLEIITQLNPTDLTDFIVIAARLIQIKSEVLLPKPPRSTVNEDEENVGEALARQLVLYKHFKEMALQLRQIEALEQRNFVRTAPPLKVTMPATETLKITLDDILRAARQVLLVKAPEPSVDVMVSRQTITIGQQMVYIRQILETGEAISFQDLLENSYTRIEIVVTLLAVLELIKRQVIEVKQEALFGDITIHRNENPPRLTEADWVELTEQVDVS